MKIIIFLILLGFFSVTEAMTVDSAKWQLPDSTVLQFTIAGLFHNYHIQLDQNGFPAGPNNYNFNSTSLVTFYPVTISQSDTNWIYVDSTQTLNYYSSISPYPYLHYNTTMQIILDSATHRIRSFTINYDYASIPSSSLKYTISISGLKYTIKNLIAEDSDITKNLLEVAYSYKEGAHSNDYGGQDLIQAAKINISGALNYNLLDIPLVAQKSDIPIVRYGTNRITILMPSQNHSKEIILYSMLGVLVSRVPIINGIVEFQTSNIPRGVYFALSDALSVKVLIQ